MKLLREIITEDKNFIFNEAVKKDFTYYKYQIIDAFKAWRIKQKLDYYSVVYKKKKYHVSICAIFKNEKPYLKEWIEFHRIIGIDHFYMYDNNSEDEGSKILEPYIASGLVTLTFWEKNQAQMEAYQDACKIAYDETEWLGFIDIDEFVIPDTETNIYDVLLNFKKRPSVLLYWHLFGTSGLLERDYNRLVLEDFTVAYPKTYRVGKCFWNTSFRIDFKSKKNSIMHHHLWCYSDNMTDIPPVNIYDEIAFYQHHIIKKEKPLAHINHYFTKSLQEYSSKMTRGDVYFTKNPHDLDYFFMHEQKCSMPDYSAYKYLIKLKMAMRG